MTNPLRQVSGFFHAISVEIVLVAKTLNASGSWTYTVLISSHTLSRPLNQLFHMPHQNFGTLFQLSSAAYDQLGLGGRTSSDF